MRQQHDNSTTDGAVLCCASDTFTYCVLNPGLNKRKHRYRRGRFLMCDYHTETTRQQCDNSTTTARQMVLCCASDTFTYCVLNLGLNKRKHRYHTAAAFDVLLSHDNRTTTTRQQHDRWREGCHDRMMDRVDPVWEATRAERRHTEGHGITHRMERLIATPQVRITTRQQPDNSKTDGEKGVTIE
ncbi:hypothetical protein Bbelb_095970 [Branchiostoma belcheri]|nr:hypothetical protein Bbelb_095970 [Branchiostoma belcheri]